MDEHMSVAMKWEIDSLKRQLTAQFPISEPTIRQTFLRILTIIDNILDVKEE